MSTPSHIAAESSTVPNIASYWNFALNPLNQGKSIVKSSSNRLGIAIPRAAGDRHITFLNREGVECCSDNTEQIVAHFKKALANKYEAELGRDSDPNIFAPREIVTALQSGLSHRIVLQVYEKIHRVITMKKFFSQVIVCSQKAERACIAASTASPKEAKQFALEAQEQARLAKEKVEAARAIVAAFPEETNLRGTVNLIRAEANNAFASATDAADIVSRNFKIRS